MQSTAQLSPRFSVGQKFYSHGKNPKLCTVLDILTTYNLAGEVIRIRYVAEHEILGQKVIDHDVLETSIAMRVVETGECPIR